MPQIIVCEWRIIFSENLLHKISYPVKDPWLGLYWALLGLSLLGLTVPYLALLCLTGPYRVLHRTL